MLLFLLASLILGVWTDPCNNCPLPAAFAAGDADLCQNAQNDTSYAPTLIRFSRRSSCYLQMTDCPAYDIITDSQCIGILPPQKALKCVDGKFRTFGMSLGFPLDKIRCNPAAFITPIPPSTCSDCFTPMPFTSCDSTYKTFTVPFIAQPFEKNGRCYLNFNNSRPSNCARLSVQTGFAADFGDDEEMSCYIEKEANPVAVCENRMFQIDSQDLVAYQCEDQPTDPIDTSDCGNDWKYNWMTDSFFKLGYNKTYEKAREACIADGGELASIHSQEDNDFIAILSFMQHENATVGEGIFIWIGVFNDGGGNDTFINLDGTPYDYSYWAHSNPSGDGPCVRMSTGGLYDLAGKWNDFLCSESHAYACRWKGGQPPVQRNCSSCIPLMQMPYPYIPTTNGNITITYDYSSGCMVPTFSCIGPYSNVGAYLQTANTIFNGFAGGCGQVSHTGRYKCTEDGTWLDETRGVPLPPYVACTQANNC